LASALHLAFIAGFPILLLGACSTTRFVSSDATDNGLLPTPSPYQKDAFVDDEPAVWWAHQYSLPREIHGSIPGHSVAETASLARRLPPPGDGQFNPAPSVIDRSGRILLYFNPAILPDDDSLCEEARQIGTAPQDGRDTDVTSALCDGSKTLAVVHAVVSAETSDPKIKDGLATIESSLFWDLYKTPWMP
jgi:hypothetical protein